MWACASKRLDVVVELLSGEDAGMIDNSPYRPMIGRDTTTSEVRFSSKTLPQSGWRRLLRFSIVPPGMRQKLEHVQLRVGRNIRHFRRLRGWSLEKFAERVAMSGKHLGEVERGNIQVDVRLLTRLANLFGVDVAELFSGAANDTTDAPILVVISRRDFDRVEKALEFLQRVRRSRPRRRSK